MASDLGRRHWGSNTNTGLIIAKPKSMLVVTIFMAWLCSLECWGVVKMREGHGRGWVMNNSYSRGLFFHTELFSTLKNLYPSTISLIFVVLDRRKLWWWVLVRDTIVEKGRQRRSYFHSEIDEGGGCHGSSGSSGSDVRVYSFGLSDFVHCRSHPLESCLSHRPNEVWRKSWALQPWKLGFGGNLCLGRW